ncbi:hypothetical protein BDR05DRAFT_1001804 [Suillus weaverae]|nr:hypothetical protein BDR05DRAFT_1001804 [Suillus weaverae]
MAMNMFLVKEDKKKQTKSRKGDHKRKQDIGGSATTDASDKIVPHGKKCAHRAISAKGKSKAIVESEDEDMQHPIKYAVIVQLICILQELHSRVVSMDARKDVVNTLRRLVIVQFFITLHVECIQWLKKVS